MKWFLKLIEVAKTNGIEYVPNLNEAVSGDFKNAGFPSNVEDAFAKAKPFVFERFTLTPPQDENADELLKNIVDIDMPFEACSFEFLSGSMFKEEKFEIFCTFVFEKEPRKFIAISLIECFGKMRAVVDYPRKAAPLFLEQLKKCSIGAQSVGVRVKRKHREKEKDFKICQIIHVAPKKYREKYETENHLNIDWTHRWLVRGHWRKIADNMLGKNRAGEYVQAGYTWVTEHEKGPEHVPLIANKVRLVRSIENEQDNRDA